MKERNSKKINKTLFVPLWVAEVVNIQGELYGGPGEVAAAAIVAFASLTDDEKTKVLSNYRIKEVEAIHRDCDLEKKEARQKKEQSRPKAIERGRLASPPKAG